MSVLLQSHLLIHRYCNLIGDPHEQVHEVTIVAATVDGVSGSPIDTSGHVASVFPPGDRWTKDA